MTPPAKRENPLQWCELIRHDDAGHDTHAERDGEDLQPERIEIAKTSLRVRATRFEEAR